MTLQLRVYVPDHPLIKHWLAIARSVQTPYPLFKMAMTELGRWLTYEATRYWYPTVDVIVETPLSDCPATIINEDIPTVIIPILRAGLAILDGAQTALPNNASIYHLGLVRDEETLESSCYLNRLPDRFAPQTHIIILEPMLATGGSILSAMSEITSRGGDPAFVRIISIVAAPPALQKLSEKYPSLNIYTAIIDQEINEKGFIVPGLGDAGDRAFGT
ncbi:uracil phosphoribosyltransferase [Chroococcus sp. FPU101]|uniref:uracil phosphoribosyltransferase n=1 Tax=Chroococcus sp. FPU101 TaxID=1974212 RepID=UPI001A8DDE5A|nr:uracil phosphoribosyltransferase [Chroococcus sp. FPU101]GFE67972.1 uracil phosphoribosyltransferase [Chroococcus sp. FPU101]